MDTLRSSTHDSIRKKHLTTKTSGGMALLLLLTSFLIASAAHGVDKARIAVVDMDNVFTTYYKTRIANAKIKKQAEVYRDYLNSIAKEIERLKAEAIKLRDDSVNIGISDSERERCREQLGAKAKLIETREGELTQYNREKREELYKKFTETRKTLADEVIKVIGSHAKRHGYTLVLDRSGKTTNDIPSVVFFDDGIDITEQVVKEVNLGSPPESEIESDTARIEVDTPRRSSPPTSAADLLNDIMKK